MESIVERLLEYLRTTPKEQQEKDWAEVAEYRDGPTIDEFLEWADAQCGHNFEMNSVNYTYNPEFSSGLFFYRLKYN